MRAKPYPPMEQATRSRKWLNPTTGAAHIEWSVHLPKLSGRKDKYISDDWNTFRMSDCTRHISLDFDSDKKGIAKVTKLIDSLLAFRTALCRADAKVMEILAANPKVKR